PCGRHVVFLERFDDDGNGVAEAPKAHQQIEHHRIPDEAKQRMNVIRGPPHDNCDGDRRDDGQSRRNGALPCRSAVELAFEPANIADKRALRAGAPPERMPLLEAERREDREQIHRNAIRFKTRRERVAYVRSSSRSRYCSRTSGLASASMFFTSRPC